MTTQTTIRGFAGEIVEPGHATYDGHREIWNAMVDRRPALIARCTSADDVAAAIRHGRDTGLEIAVKCGGHGVLGLAVPEGGLMIDLTPMGEVRVDPDRRRGTSSRRPPASRHARHERARHRRTGTALA